MAADLTKNDAAAGRWLPRSLGERIGAVLVAPARALAAADDPDAAGRAATDAALLMVASVLALSTVDVVRAVWLGAADSIMVAVHALMSLVGRALGPDLVLLLVAGTAVTLAAGRSRSVGRDFDLACVAYVPFVVTRLAAELAMSAFGLPASAGVGRAVLVIGVAWAVVVLSLAIREARRRG